MELFKTFTFEAAHWLPHVPAGHKCARVHGHTYVVEIYTRGKVDPHTGWIHDLADIKVAFEPLLNQLDHYQLNDIEGLENPTVENIARWIGDRLKPALPHLWKIKMWETRSSGCVYTLPEE